jgi:hypothetical protein
MGTSASRTKPSAPLKGTIIRGDSLRREKSLVIGNAFSQGHCLPVVTFFLLSDGIGFGFS